MRPAQAKSTFKVDFGPPRPTTKQTSRNRIPRVARMLALAHRIEAMVHSGEFHDYTYAARTIGVTRARMSQILGLLLLAPEIQEAIVNLPAVTEGRDPVSERQLRPIAAESEWNKQLALWADVSPMR